MDIMRQELLHVQNAIINVQHVREHQPIVKLVQVVIEMLQQHAIVEWDYMMMVWVLVVNLAIILAKPVLMQQSALPVMEPNID